MFAGRRKLWHWFHWRSSGWTGWRSCSPARPGKLLPFCWYGCPAAGATASSRPVVWELYLWHGPVCTDFGDFEPLNTCIAVALDCADFIIAFALSAVTSVVYCGCCLNEMLHSGFLPETLARLSCYTDFRMAKIIVVNTLHFSHFSMSSMQVF